MRRLRAFLGIVLTCCLTFAPSTAWAEDINWSYSWSGTASVPNASGGGVILHMVSGIFANDKNDAPAVFLESFGPTGPLATGRFRTGAGAKKN